MSSCPTIIQDLIIEAKEGVNRVKDMLIYSNPTANKMLQEVVEKLNKISSMDSSKAMSGSFCEDSVCSDDRKSENFIGKRKFSPVTGIDKTGASRRRSQVSTISKTTKNLDDGHTWRKYGQKDIQSSSHPRSYFRCTHKLDQGCMATRQVQPTEDDPCTFNVTYIGDHTCQDPSTFHQYIETPDPLQTNNSFLISFGSPNANNNSLKFIKKEEKSTQVSIKTSSFAPMNEGSYEDVFSNNFTPESSPVDELAAIVGSTSQTFSLYDQGEIISSSPRSMDLEFMPSSMFGLDIHDEYSLFRFDNEDGDFPSL